MTSDGARKGDWRLPVIVPLGWLLLRLLGLTWRIRTVNTTAWRALRDSRKGFVFAVWHGNQLPLIYQHRGEGLAALVSEHRDGEIIARIMSWLGYGLIRGSSSRGGSRALIRMIRALEEGVAVAVTPDGPRGPAHRFAAGALVSAQRAAAPIVLIAADVDRAWRFRSWDGFTVPKPFARVTIRYSLPTMVRGATPAEAADDAPRFESMMAELAAAPDA